MGRDVALRLPRPRSLGLPSALFLAGTAAAGTPAAVAPAVVVNVYADIGQASFADALASAEALDVAIDGLLAPPGRQRGRVISRSRSIASAIASSTIGKGR